MIIIISIPIYPISANMGFLKGFLIAIPIGLYFGERGLDFPLTARLDSTSKYL